MNRKIGLYPGCSLEGTSSAYLKSLAGVLDALGLACEEIQDWSCCGASAAHAIDHKLYLTLNARNLALAQAQDYGEIIAPCAACYHRLICAQLEFTRSPETLDAINAEAGLDYRGGVKVSNVLDYFSEAVGAAQVASRRKRSLSGLRAVCYYGCLNSRIPHISDRTGNAAGQVGRTAGDEYPMQMDRLVQAAGVETLDWSYKTDCCGAGMSVTAESISKGLIGKILQDAAAVGADCIVVACPMCQNNLDAKQDIIREEYGIERPLPVLFFTQVLGLALGLSPDEVNLGDGCVPFAWPQAKRQQAVEAAV